MPPATHVPDDRVPDDRVPGDPGPPPSPAPWPVQRRLRSRRPWLAVAGVGLVLVVSSAGGLAHSESHTEVVPFTGGTISFDTGPTDVTVLGGAPAGTVEVTRHLEWGVGGSKPTVDEAWDGETAVVHAPDCTGWDWRCSVDYVVRVPDTTAITLDGGSGDVVLEGPLGTVRLELGSGDVEARALASSDIRMVTGSGDLDLELDSAPASVVLRAGSGDIDLELVSGPASLDVTTGSGDVAIDAAEGERYRLDVGTGSGKQDLDLASDADASQRVRVRTGSGDVEIH
ncbi:hypothetical protein IDVR_13300 [Intrasporangium sp. DVR]